MIKYVRPIYENSPVHFISFGRPCAFELCIISLRPRNRFRVALSTMNEVWLPGIVNKKLNLEYLTIFFNSHELLL